MFRLIFALCGLGVNRVVPQTLCNAYHKLLILIVLQMFTRGVAILESQ